MSQPAQSHLGCKAATDNFSSQRDVNALITTVIKCVTFVTWTLGKPRTTGKCQRTTQPNTPSCSFPYNIFFFFLAFTQSYAMNWQYMPSHVLSYFFNLFLHISVKPTQIFWSYIMLYLHFIISVQLMSNLFIFIKEQRPFPPCCPRCNNENQNLSEG